MDLKTQFKDQIQAIHADFRRKMEQNQLSQIQERLVEDIFETMRNVIEIRDLPQMAVYDNNAAQLAALGKTYRNVLEEKLFTDGYRTFEEFISSIFNSIFMVFPYLLLGDKEADSNELKIPFHFIFTDTPDLEACKQLIIESRVKTYMQGDNISKILERFKSTFYLKVNLTDGQRLECQRNALIRNIITHNNSYVNQIYINSVINFKIKGNTYEIGDCILPYLETEINHQRDIFKSIAEQIVQDLESIDNLKALDGRNTTLKAKL
jgi:hypothetical protein